VTADNSSVRVLFLPQSLFIRKILRRLVQFNPISLDMFRERVLKARSYSGGPS
jgi:hypothetical protein